MQRAYRPSTLLVNPPEVTEATVPDGPELSLRTSVLQWQASLGGGEGGGDFREVGHRANEGAADEAVQQGAVNGAAKELGQEGRNSTTNAYQGEFDEEDEFADLYATADQIAESENANRAHRDAAIATDGTPFPIAGLDGIFNGPHASRV